MANELFACTGTLYSTPAGNQNLGRSIVRVEGVKTGGTHYTSLTSRTVTVNIATYTDTWTDLFDENRYYSGDTDN